MPTVCLSVCLQLYAFGNRKSNRSEILGHDLVVSEGVQYQISSKSDHGKGVFTLLRSGLRKFQPFPHIYYCTLMKFFHMHKGIYSMWKNFICVFRSKYASVNISSRNDHFGTFWNQKFVFGIFNFFQQIFS